MTGVLLDRALKNYYSVTAFGSKELIDNNQIVPVSESEICGDVMVCSYGDLNDVQVFREFGLKEIVAIDQYGKIGEMELR